MLEVTSVRRLDAFGSVVRADFSPERSDIDLVVEFDALPPSALAEAYFTLTVMSLATHPGSWKTL